MARSQTIKNALVMNAVLADSSGDIRQVLPEHIQEIFEVELLAYPFPWTIGLLKDCLKPNYHFYAIFRQGSIVAYGILSCVLNEAHILNICVSPVHQQQGLGRRMLNHLLDVARQEKSHTVFLEVRKSNQAAQRMYESSGFNQLDIRKGYYPDHSGREDAVIYAKELPGYMATEH